MVEGLLYSTMRLLSVTGICRSRHSSMTVVVAAAAATAITAAVAAAAVPILFIIHEEKKNCFSWRKNIAQYRIDLSDLGQ